MCDLLPEPVRAKVRKFFAKNIFYINLQKDRIKLKFWRMKTKIKNFIKKQKREKSEIKNSEKIQT